jgi:hypothetical protein
MADITMCNGDQCDIKENCYRYTANPSLVWQSMFMTSPIQDKIDLGEEVDPSNAEEYCSYFWDNSDM